jgi:RNA polymerase subunit RPABC4/transcription elongation factor Spt4
MTSAGICINERDAVTAAVKACTSCDGQLLASDRFCRWCGEAQTGETSGALVVASGVASERLAAASYATSLLDGARRDLYHRVSGPLVEAVVANVASGQLGEQGRLMRRLMLALISQPIWLMIVLLSPLDAYAAAKNLLRENQ